MQMWSRNTLKFRGYESRVLQRVAGGRTRAQRQYWKDGQSIGRSNHICYALINSISRPSPIYYALTDFVWNVFQLKTFWQSSLLHDFENITSKDHDFFDITGKAVVNFIASKF